MKRSSLGLGALYDDDETDLHTRVAHYLLLSNQSSSSSSSSSASSTSTSHNISQEQESRKRMALVVDRPSSGSGVRQAGSRVNDPEFARLATEALGAALDPSTTISSASPRERAQSSGPRLGQVPSHFEPREAFGALLAPLRQSGSPLFADPRRSSALVAELLQAPASSIPVPRAMPGPDKTPPKPVAPRRSAVSSRGGASGKLKAIRRGAEARRGFLNQAQQPAAPAPLGAPSGDETAAAVRELRKWAAATGAFSECSVPYRLGWDAAATDAAALLARSAASESNSGSELFGVLNMATHIADLVAGPSLVVSAWASDVTKAVRACLNPHQVVVRIKAPAGSFIRTGLNGQEGGGAWYDCLLVCGADVLLRDLLGINQEAASLADPFGLASSQVYSANNSVARIEQVLAPKIVQPFCLEGASIRDRCAPALIRAASAGKSDASAASTLFWHTHEAIQIASMAIGVNAVPPFGETTVACAEGFSKIYHDFVGSVRESATLGEVLSAVRKAAAARNEPADRPLRQLASELVAVVLSAYTLENKEDDRASISESASRWLTGDLLFIYSMRDTRDAKFTQMMKIFESLERSSSLFSANAALAWRGASVAAQRGAAAVAAYASSCCSARASLRLMHYLAPGAFRQIARLEARNVRAPRNAPVLALAEAAQRVHTVSADDSTRRKAAVFFFLSDLATGDVTFDGERADAFLEFKGATAPRSADDKLKQKLEFAKIRISNSLEAFFDRAKAIRDSASAAGESTSVERVGFFHLVALTAQTQRSRTCLEHCVTHLTSGGDAAAYKALSEALSVGKRSIAPSALVHARSRALEELVSGAAAGSSDLLRERVRTVARVASIDKRASLDLASVDGGALLDPASVAGAVSRPGDSRPAVSAYLKTLSENLGGKQPAASSVAAAVQRLALAAAAGLAGVSGTRPFRAALGDLYSMTAYQIVSATGARLAAERDTGRAARSPVVAFGPPPSNEKAVASSSSMKITRGAEFVLLKALELSGKPSILPRFTSISVLVGDETRRATILAGWTSLRAGRWKEYEEAAARDDSRGAQARETAGFAVFQAKVGPQLRGMDDTPVLVFLKAGEAAQCLAPAPRAVYLGELLDESRARDSAAVGGEAAAALPLPAGVLRDRCSARYEVINHYFYRVLWSDQVMYATESRRLEAGARGGFSFAASSSVSYAVSTDALLRAASACAEVPRALAEQHLRWLVATVVAPPEGVLDALHGAQAELRSQGTSEWLAKNGKAGDAEKWDRLVAAVGAGLTQIAGLNAADLVADRLPSTAVAREAAAASEAAIRVLLSEATRAKAAPPEAKSAAKAAIEAEDEAYVSATRGRRKRAVSSSAENVAPVTETRDRVSWDEFERKLLDGAPEGVSETAVVREYMASIRSLFEAFAQVTTGNPSTARLLPKLSSTDDRFACLPFCDNYSVEIGLAGSSANSLDPVGHAVKDGLNSLSSSVSRNRFVYKKTPSRERDRLRGEGLSHEIEAPVVPVQRSPFYKDEKSSATVASTYTLSEAAHQKVEKRDLDPPAAMKHGTLGANELSEAGFKWGTYRAECSMISEGAPKAARLRDSSLSHKFPVSDRAGTIERAIAEVGDERVLLALKAAEQVGHIPVNAKVTQSYVVTGREAWKLGVVGKLSALLAYRYMPVALRTLLFNAFIADNFKHADKSDNREAKSFLKARLRALGGGNQNERMVRSFFPVFSGMQVHCRTGIPFSMSWAASLATREALRHPDAPRYHIAHASIGGKTSSVERDMVYFAVRSRMPDGTIVHSFSSDVAKAFVHESYEAVFALSFYKPDMDTNPTSSRRMFLSILRLAIRDGVRYEESCFKKGAAAVVDGTTGEVLCRGSSMAPITFTVFEANGLVDAFVTQYMLDGTSFVDETNHRKALAPSDYHEYFVLIYAFLRENILAHEEVKGKSAFSGYGIGEVVLSEVLSTKREDGEDRIVSSRASRQASFISAAEYEHLAAAPELSFAAIRESFSAQPAPPAAGDPRLGAALPPPLEPGWGLVAAQAAAAGEVLDQSAGGEEIEWE
jgi:hypothetical protein